MKPIIKFIIAFVLLLTATGITQQFSESNDFSYALKLYNEGFYDISAKQFSAFVNNYPNSDRLPDAKYYLADALYKLKDYSNARIEFQSLAVAYPDYERSPLAWKMVGELYEKMKKYQDAATAYQTVKVLYPKHPLAPPSLLKAAEVYLTIKQYSQAEMALHEFLDRYVESPEYPNGRLLLGKLLAGKEDYKPAIREFEKVLKTTEEPRLKAEANYGIAEVYRLLSLNIEAINYYQKVLEVENNSPTAFNTIVHLAEIYQARNQWDNSIALLEKYKNNFNSDFHQFLLNLLLAQSHFLNKDYFAARKILDKTASLSSNKSDKLRVQFYLAACYQEERKSEKAISEYESILSRLPDDTSLVEILPVALQNLSTLYLSADNLQKAHKYINQYHRKYPANETGEKLYYNLINTAFRLKNFSYGLDELKKFSVNFPRSNYLDDLIYKAGSSFFNMGKYPQSGELLQRIVDDYYCSASWDSANARLHYIKNNFVQDQNLGVSGLVKLMAKFLADEDRNMLLLELGKIYLNDLKDYKGAMEVFQKCLEQSPDSAFSGKALYYLSESLLRQSRFQAFPKHPLSADFPETTESIKLAMQYIKYAPYPDSLMFRFIDWSLYPANKNIQKAIEFWQHFETSFPTTPLLPYARMRLAKYNRIAGDNTGALAHYDKVISASPGSFVSGSALWEKAILQAEQGDLQAAIGNLKDFLLNYPKHPKQAQAYWQLADYNARSSDYFTAAQFLERLEQLYGYTDFAENARSRIADYYILGNDYGKALEYVESQIRELPDYTDPVVKYFTGIPRTDLFFYAGKAYFSLNEFPQSRKNLLKYLSISQAGEYRNEALLLLGEISYQQGRNESALMHLSLVSAGNDPSVFYKANEISADILFNIKEYPAAREKYNNLVQSSKNVDKKIFYSAQKLRCLIREGKIKVFNSELAAFKKTYSKHRRKNSYLASFELELGKYAYSKKNFNGALSHYSKILKSYKKTEYADDALYYQGLCYTTLNKVDNALKKFNTFLKEYPKSPLLGDVYNSIGNLYLQGEKTELAMDSFRKAVESATTPESKRAAMSNLIKLYRDLGMWDSALQLTRQYVEEFPNADDIIDKKILLGICLSNMNRYAEAVDYLKKIKFEASSEQEPEIQFYIGEAYFNAGQYENAIGEFVKIPLLSKKTKLQWEASALYYSGQAYEKLGRTDDAIRMYQEIVNRPGILLELKREAKNRIASLSN